MSRRTVPRAGRRPGPRSSATGQPPGWQQIDDPCLRTFLAAMPRVCGNNWLATASGGRPLGEYTVAIGQLSAREVRAGIAATMKRPGTIAPSPGEFVRLARSAGYQKTPEQLARGVAAIAEARAKLEDVPR